MILDEDDLKLYFRNISISLNKNQIKLLSLFISKKDTYVSLKEIICYMYNVKYDSYISYASVARNFINRLNMKLYPFAKIIVKNKIGYRIKLYVTPKEEQWKKDFLKEHKDELLLLKKYKELEKKKKEVQEIENNIKTIEKYLF